MRPRLPTAPDPGRPGPWTHKAPKTPFPRWPLLHGTIQALTRGAKRPFRPHPPLPPALKAPTSSTAGSPVPIPRRQVGDATAKRLPNPLQNPREKSGRVTRRSSPEPARPGGVW
ncbi:hypothetical protein PAHAL_9G573100 [Panicum hallii]|uniref:Uncharacterized protein n=1 Tax=Panicum hallii TaxID=206008 RepID=A0A2T8I619_9POAL|nr:hypothetical protein PAHAL_9G573100 [Panicum hallii]